jgi:cellulose synthase/poly-beta-1,6-N-acetylglucosamine synthase-like glycosyltransferase
VTAILLLCAGLLLYLYVGYPALLALLRLLPARLPRSARVRPSLSVIIAARDEARVLPRKLKSLLGPGYPPGLLEIIVVSDGSRDATAQVARNFGPAVQVVELARPGGKPQALNAAVGHARGEVLVLTDARQPLLPGSLDALVEPFADESVGAVTGCLAVAGGESLGLYRRYDDWIRREEARRGSSIGVTGALWALRRSLYTPVGPGALADDLFLPMMVIGQRRRVVVAPAARAVDVLPRDPRADFRRRVRTLAGNFQLLREAPWLLRPDRNPAFFAFVSHKVLRLASPALLALLLLFSLARTGPLFGAVLAGQVLLYGLALAGCFAEGAEGVIAACARGALAFVMVNVAVMAAAVALARGRAGLLWRPTDARPDTGASSPMGRMVSS